MRLPPFQYFAPRSVEDAVRLLVEHGQDAMVVAGGTDLFPNMKRRQFEPKVLVGLRGIREFVGVSGDPKRGMTIGATTTLTAISNHLDVQTHYPALARAARLISTPQLQNMGTIGGNVCLDTRCNYYNQSYHWRKSIGFCLKKDGDICLVAPGSPKCWAISSSDSAPVLWSLGARVRLLGPKGERDIPIQQLFQDDGINYLTKAPDEILTHVRLPAVDGWRSTYLKLRRRGAFDFPILGVAVALQMEGEVVREARIVFGAVACQPRESKEAAEALRGQRLTPELIAEVAQVASKPAKPLDNTDLTHPYRKRMSKVFVARALRELAGLPIRGDES